MILHMKAQAMIQMISGIVGLLLVMYGIMVALGRAPVFTLYKSKTEKERRKENLFHSLGYGGIGFIGLMQAVYFFSGWEWAAKLMSSARVVITIYLLYACSFRMYVKGFVPGDSIEEDK